MRHINRSGGFSRAFVFAMATTLLGMTNAYADVKTDKKSPYGNSRSQERNVICESKDFRYNYYAVSGQIASARIAQQYSNSRCSLGRDWGYSRGGIWTQNGCRASFIVKTGGNSRSATGYEPPRNTSSYGRTNDRDRNRNDNYRDRDRRNDRDRYGDRNRDRNDRYRGQSTSKRYALDYCTRRISKSLYSRGADRVSLNEICSARRRYGNQWDFELEFYVRGYRDRYSSSSNNRRNRGTYRAYSCSTDGYDARIRPINSTRDIWGF